jgi:hypothetical protein
MHVFWPFSSPENACEINIHRGNFGFDIRLLRTCIRNTRALPKAILPWTLPSLKVERTDGNHMLVHGIWGIDNVF